MYKYHCLNPISEVGLGQLDENYVVTGDVEEADAILVRSAKMHDMEFSKNLKAIARAGAGVNNIPLDRCADEGIVVFNTPGANANGVKELVIAGMLLAARDIIGGINWGSIGLFQFDIVSWIFGGQAAVMSRIIYTLVAISAVWCISLLFRENEVLSSANDE